MRNTPARNPQKLILPFRQNKPIATKISNCDKPKLHDQFLAARKNCGLG